MMVLRGGLKTLKGLEGFEGFEGGADEEGGPLWGRRPRESPGGEPRGEEKAR